MQPLLPQENDVTLNILAVTSEAFPLAKTGGLGDAVSGLAQATHQCAASVTLLLPLHRGVSPHLRRVREVAVLSDLPGGEATLLAGYCPALGLPVLALKNDDLYDRDGLYLNAEGEEYADNAIRFAALAHAATRIAQGRLPIAPPHIVHVHDWHAALTPLLMHQAGIHDIKSILTLHNVAFQGVFPMALAASLGIEEKYCQDDGAGFWGQINFLKAGIRFADLITAVSRNYAREILTPEFGCGLEALLNERKDRLVAVPNGIDTALWNPQCDPYLKGRQFSARKLKNKSQCKRALQRAFSLECKADTTIMAIGSRLTTQKMADVAVEAIPRALDQYPALQVCVMGRGEKHLEAALLAMSQRYEGRCGVRIGFDESRAHWLHAGADILLHGSRFEPFGLTPLYAMRYGTIPIGSKVGGMVDTITDPGPQQPIEAMREATGILFQGESVQAMNEAIIRAMALRAHPDIWHAMQQNGMNADFSWARTAPEYMRLYHMLAPDPTPKTNTALARRSLPARLTTAMAPMSISAFKATTVSGTRKAAPASENGALKTLSPHGA